MKNFLRKRMSLSVVLVLTILFTMLASAFITSGVTFFLMRMRILRPFRGPDPISPLFWMMLSSILLGTVLAVWVSRRTLKPLQKIIDATHRVAAGDFSIQVEAGSVPEMEDLTASFNTMVRELGSIETLRSDFINNFSHEFKTPIVSIRGFAKLLRNKALPEKDRDEYVEIIIQESERLAGLAANVLALSKLENTGILTDCRPFRVDEQIRRAAALMEPRWREKNLSVSLEMESVVVTGDEDLLQQVWVNLLDNAIKFTETDGTLSIALQQRENTVEFRLADDGIGMDEQTLSHLFDKFYQGDKSHAGAGNGLGLSLVKQILSICEGKIEVESAPGCGSVFTVFLPAGV